MPPSGARYEFSKLEGGGGIYPIVDKGTFP